MSEILIMKIKILRSLINGDLNTKQVLSEFPFTDHRIEILPSDNDSQLAKLFMTDGKELINRVHVHTELLELFS